MKKYIVPIVLVAFLAIGFFFAYDGRTKAQAVTKPAADQVKTMPEVIILAKDSAQGNVTFNHLKHNGGEYTNNGKIACIECHHTAQPAAALAKYPPLKTAWPAGRTATLTAELFAKDPNAAGVAACRDCHARSGTKPKLLPEIPVMKDDSSTTFTTMTNQMAFHRICDICHFQVSINRAESKVPKPTECWVCHKKVATGSGM